MQTDALLKNKKQKPKIQFEEDTIQIDPVQPKKYDQEEEDMFVLLYTS